MPELALIEAIRKTMTVGGAGVWVLVFLFGVTLVKAWPALAKLKNDSDASLRADLLKLLAVRDARIAALEAKLLEQQVSFDKQMMAERAQCREEIDELRAEIAGLHRQIIQNSRTTAQMIGDPGTAPTTAAKLKEDGK